MVAGHQTKREGDKTPNISKMSLFTDKNWFLTAEIHKLTSQIWKICKTPITGHQACTCVTFEKTVSLGKYALLSSSCPEEGRLGVTQHNIITPKAQTIQRATDLWETRIFPHQRKLIVPLNQIQTSLRKAHQHVFSYYVQILCLCVSDRDRLSPVIFDLVVCRSKGM